MDINEFFENMQISAPSSEAPAQKYAHLKTPEKRKQYNQAFYEKNKGKDIKRECFCGGRYTIFNQSHHKKSKRHLKSIPVVEFEF